MTAPQEPLVMTLEAAIALLAERGKCLTRSSGRWYIVPSPSDLDGSEAWDNELSNFLDHPVVARDDAAELRAALVELVRLKNGPRDDAYYHDREHAWAAARAALAATEGQP